MIDIKRIRKYLIISLLIFAIITGIFIGTKTYKEKKIETISSTIEEKIVKIAELSTIKYNYTNIVAYKNSKELKGLTIPFTSKSFIVKYGGYIKAGIDLSTIDIDMINRDTINLTIDKTKILENVIIEEEVMFFDEKQSIFNKLNFSDLYDELIIEKKRMEEEAINKGLLEEGDIKAQEIIKELLLEMDFKNINIKFR